MLIGRRKRRISPGLDPSKEPKRLVWKRYRLAGLWGAEVGRLGRKDRWQEKWKSHQVTLGIGLLGRHSEIPEWIELKEWKCTFSELWKLGVHD